MIGLIKHLKKCLRMRMSMEKISSGNSGLIFMKDFFSNKNFPHSLLMDFLEDIFLEKINPQFLFSSCRTLFQTKKSTLRSREKIHPQFLRKTFLV